MFDIYDSSCFYVNRNQDKSYYKQNKFGNSILEEFIAWSILEKKEDDFFRLKEEFLKLIYNSNDVVLGILASDENMDVKKAHLDFYYTKENYFHRIQEFYQAEKMKENTLALPLVSGVEAKESSYETLYENLNNIRNLERETELKTLLGKKEVRNRLVNMTFDGEMKVHIHVSYINPKKLSVYFFRQSGLFISVGIDYDIDMKYSYDFNDYISIFKVLGDETRLKMVKSLVRTSLTSAELSQEVEVTLSTINHHLKQLMSLGLVESVLNTEAHKGTRYQLCTRNIERMIGGILDEIQ